MIVGSSISRGVHARPVVVVLSVHQSRVCCQHGLVGLVLLQLAVVGGGSVKVWDGDVGRPGLVCPGGGDSADLPDLLANVLPSVVRIDRSEAQVGAGRDSAPALAGLALFLRWWGGVGYVGLRDWLALDVQSLGQLVQSGQVGGGL